MWPYEENDEFGFVQELFSMMHALFSVETEALTLGRSVQSSEVYAYVSFWEN